jgi:signal transduction histidine kinase
MRERIRNGAAIVIAGLCVATAIPSVVGPDRTTSRISLKWEGSNLVIGSVDSAAMYADLVKPGMTISEINYAPVTAIPPDGDLMEKFLRGDFFELGVDVPVSGITQVTQLTFMPDVGFPEQLEFLVGLLLLFGGALWVGRGHAGETLRRLALPIATASASPLILAPAFSSLAWPLVIAAIPLPTVGLVVLADGFVERITHAIRRRLAAWIAFAAGIAYVMLNVGAALVMRMDFTLYIAALSLLAVVTLAPAAILLASPRGAEAMHGGISYQSSDRMPVLLAALTPIVISGTYGYDRIGLGLTIPLIWLLLVVVLLQANARVATLRVQRDMIVAATEVERARLAADLHDDALQEMTVLLRDLDEAGNDRPAALARSIADRLREVCGELRLPILDELGAGPALEWLVTRAGETSGRDVRLEREDGMRPPAEVELAVFRVAQEALANALTHGAPPVRVVYAASSDRASLVIRDQGPGIPPDAAVVARRSGHYGLLNMRQRAEQIGATFDVRRMPDGGTSVDLSWSSA